MIVDKMNHIDLINLSLGRVEGFLSPFLVEKDSKDGRDYTLFHTINSLLKKAVNDFEELKVSLSDEDISRVSWIPRRYKEPIEELELLKGKLLAVAALMIDSIGEEHEERRQTGHLIQSLLDQFQLNIDTLKENTRSVPPVEKG